MPIQGLRGLTAISGCRFMLAADLLCLDIHQQFCSKPAAEAAVIEPLKKRARVAHAETARAVGSLEGREEFLQSVFKSLPSRHGQGCHRLADPWEGPLLV